MTRLAFAVLLLASGFTAPLHDVPALPSAAQAGKHRPSLPRVSRSVTERLPLRKSMVSPRTVQPSPKPAAGGVSEPWRSLAECESGGNWQANTGNGFYGGLQFTLSTWRAFGGGGFASYPYDASPPEQIRVARRVLAVQGWGAWPTCSARLGLS